jgi:hypothetical protein
MKWITGVRGSGYWHVLACIRHWKQTYSNGMTDSGTFYTSGCGAGGWFADYARIEDDEPTTGRLCPKCKTIAHLVKTGNPLEVNTGNGHEQ